MHGGLLFQTSFSYRCKTQIYCPDHSQWTTYKQSLTRRYKEPELEPGHHDNPKVLHELDVSGSVSRETVGQIPDAPTTSDEGETDLVPSTQK